MYTRRIKVIKVTDSSLSRLEGKDLYITDSFQYGPDGVNWGPTGTAGCPSQAKNYIPYIGYYEPEWRKEEILKNAEKTFEDDLASIRLVGEPKISQQSCAWHFDSVAVVEIDIVTTYNVVYETPHKSL